MRSRCSIGEGDDFVVDICGGEVEGADESLLAVWLVWLMNCWKAIEPMNCSGVSSPNNTPSESTWHVDNFPFASSSKARD